MTAVLRVEAFEDDHGSSDGALSEAAAIAAFFLVFLGIGVCPASVVTASGTCMAGLLSALPGDFFLDSCFFTPSPDWLADLSSLGFLAGAPAPTCQQTNKLRLMPR